MPSDSVTISSGRQSTRGKARAVLARRAPQCVVARRPSSRPAAAGSATPEHTLAMRAPRGVHAAQEVDHRRVAREELVEAEAGRGHEHEIASRRRRRARGRAGSCSGAVGPHGAAADRGRAHAEARLRGLACAARARARRRRGTPRAARSRSRRGRRSRKRTVTSSMAASAFWQKCPSTLSDRPSGGKGPTRASSLRQGEPPCASS